DRVDSNLLAGRRDAVELATVRSGAGPADDDAITGAEDLLDVPVPLDALLVHLDRVGHRLRAGAALGELRIVERVVGGEEPGRQLVLPIVVRLFVEAAYDGFVLCRHGVPPWGSSWCSLFGPSHGLGSNRLSDATAVRGLSHCTHARRVLDHATRCR